MTQANTVKEPMLKKSITVGEVLALAITILGVGVAFYTTVQVRLGALEFKFEQMQQEQKDYKNSQIEFQQRLESKVDKIKDDISNIRVDNEKNRK